MPGLAPPITRTLLFFSCRIDIEDYPGGEMDWFSLPLAVAGLFVGGVVGLTGMGGGALMTPVLVLFFRVDTVAAISSDLLVSLIMKPFGAIPHVRKRTVRWSLVGWLALGSVPAAFAGVTVLALAKPAASFESVLTIALGIALLISATALCVRIWRGMTNRHTALGEGAAGHVDAPDIRIRPLPTVLLGVVGGFMVGITSVGAGSVIVVALLLMYPSIKASQLVGTDLVQAIPLVGSAVLAHAVFGDIHLGLTAGLLIGAIPGAVLGAMLSSTIPGGLVRRILAVLLAASGLAMLGVPTPWLVAVVIAMVVAGAVAWLVLRRRTPPALDAGGARDAHDAPAQKTRGLPAAGATPGGGT
jgi:uncharacterized membrane protein YfcA